MFLSVLCIFGIVFSCNDAFASWTTDNNTKNPIGDTAEITPTKGDPVAYYTKSSTSYYFPTIEGAVDSATSAGGSLTIYVIPGVTTSIKRNITITSSLTLSLPYEGETIQNSSNSIASITASNFADCSNHNLRQTLVYIEEGIVVTNNGTINVGGVWGHKSGGAINIVSGKYCEIQMKKNSKIASTGTINCWGYIKEFYTTSGGSTVFDGSNSTIEATSGSIHIPFVIYDFTSAGETKTLVNNGVFPFAQYDFPNLQVSTKITYQAYLKVYLRVVVNGEIGEKDAILVGNSSNDPLFVLNSGAYITIKYTSKIPGLTTTASTVGNAALTTVKSYGTVTMNYMSINIPMITTVDTSSQPIGFNYRFICEIMSGTFTFNYSVKFMPGSYLLVEKDASLVVKKTLIFYDDTFNDNRPSGKHPYPQGYDTAYLMCNGVCRPESTAKIGGLIQTTNTTNTSTRGVFDLSNLGSSSIQASMVDGYGDVNIFENAHGQIFSPSLEGDTPSDSVFISGGQYLSTNMVWYGNKSNSYDLVITIRDISSSSTMLSYAVYQADNASGANQQLKVEGSSGPNTIQIDKGKYFKIVQEFGDGASVVSSPDGFSGSVLDTWVQCNGSFEIEMIPVESVTLNIGYEGTGVNHTSISYTIYYSATSSVGSTVYKDYSNYQNSSATILFPKNMYFKVVYSSGWSSGKTTNYEIPTNGLISGDSSKHVNTNVYRAVGNFKIIVHQDYCLVGDTLISMADGTQKAVKDIEAGDLVLVFNHETGQLDVAPITFNDRDESALMNVMYCNFSNGKSVGIIAEHGFFDLDTMRYEYIKEDNYSNFIGHRFYTEEGGEAVLTSVNVVSEYTESYSPTSFFHFDYFVEGMLSMPGGIAGLFNIFEYGDDLKYDEEAYNRDIELYGLFTYEDLAPLGVTEIMFEAYAGKYLKVALGKGILTEEYLAYLIERYGGFTEGQEP